MDSALAKAQNQTDRSPEASPDLSEIRFPKILDPVTNSTFTHKDVKYLDDAAFVVAINKYRPGTPVNPEDFKSFTKVEIDHRVVIFRPGEEMYEYNAAENAFKPLKNLNVEKGVKDSITNASNEQFKEEMLKVFPGATADRLSAYDQHNKYFIGKDLAIEDKNTNSIFVLKDKSWGKLEDSQTVSLIRKSLEPDRTRLAMEEKPYVEVTLSDSLPARVSVTLDPKTLPIHTHSLSDIGPNALMASLRVGSQFLSSLLDSPAGKKVENIATDISNEIVEEKYLREEYQNPRQSILTQINALETKREFTKEGSKAHKYINDDIRCLYDVLEEFEKPVQLEYKRNLKDANIAFREENLAQLNKALDTGTINGKEVDKKTVEELLHHHKVLETIKAGGYDTSNGGLSSYGQLMLAYIDSETTKHFAKVGLNKY